MHRIKAARFVKYGAAPTRLRRKVLVTALLGALTASAWALQAAEPDRVFTDALRKAVLDNPLVATEWYRFEAAMAAERAAKGAMLPEVNLAADLSREERETPQTTFDPYSSSNNTLTINQMLFDGFDRLN